MFLVNAVAFTIALAIALTIFFRQIYGRFNLLRSATGTFTLDNIPERLNNVLVYALGQKKFIRPEVVKQGEGVAGWMHFFIFWGFTILGLQIATMFGRAYSE